MLRDDCKEGEELREDCREGLLSDDCREAELRELGKEWLLKDDWMLGLLREDWRLGLLSVPCREARRPAKVKERYRAHVKIASSSIWCFLNYTTHNKQARGK